MTDRTGEGVTDGVGTRRRFLALTGVGLATGLAGCSANDGGTTTTPEEVTVTIALHNRDEVEREFEVVVRQGTSVRDEFSGVLPADQRVEMVATVRATDEQHEFTISSAGGQRGRTWDPTECSAFVVDAVIRDGEPEFEAACRSE